MKKGLVVVISLIMGGIFMFIGLYFYETETEDSITTTTSFENEPALVPSNSLQDNTLELSYEISDTQQTGCYDDSGIISCPLEGGAFFGQDGNYEGTTPSFTDNNDGTVIDNNSGLMWQKASGEKMQYSQADTFAVSSDVAGYDDWRIPTIKELYSLMDFRGIDPNATGSSSANLIPFIDSDYFDFAYGDVSNGDRIIDSQWITSTINVSDVMGNQECFFGVNFADGRIKCYPTQSRKNNGYYLRLVRGESKLENNFIDNGNNTITDNTTGLIWQQNDSEKTMNWEESLNYCESLSLGGVTDWRLPNAKELQFIVDYSRSPGTTSSAAIDSIFESTEIQNEAGQSDYGFYWTGTTHVRHGGGYDSGVYVSFGRGLGFMQEFGGWIDVHGAGAQRSDPKSGSSSNYELGHGPQGDAIRIENYARCVRSDDSKIVSGSIDDAVVNSNNNIPNDNLPSNNIKAPPQEAISACESKTKGQSCSIQTPNGNLSGTCQALGTDLTCVP